MLVSDLMTKNVVTASASCSAAEASRLLHVHNIGALPVVDTQGALRGIVTDRDMLTRSVARDAPLGELTVGDVMSRGVVTVSPEADVREAASLMSEHRVRRLPVTRSQQLVGILSLADIARARSCDMEACLALSKISEPM